MSELPVPPSKTLALQLTVMLLCGVALYFALHTWTEWQNYSRATVTVERAARRAGHLLVRLRDYDTFVQQSPWYSREMKPPRWEKVDETWRQLPLPELVNRLASLYRLDRPFSLESFSARLDTAERRENSSGEDRTDVSQNELTFHLQGYFLCPTR